MTRQVLADDVSVRDAVDALGDVHSVVDVNIYVWQGGPSEFGQSEIAKQVEVRRTGSNGFGLYLLGFLRGLFLGCLLK